MFMGSFFRNSSAYGLLVEVHRGISVPVTNTFEVPLKVSPLNKGQSLGYDAIVCLNMTLLQVYDITESHSRGSLGWKSEIERLTLLNIQCK